MLKLWPFFLSFFFTHSLLAQESLPFQEIAKFYVDNHIAVGIAGTVFENGEFRDFTYGERDYRTKSPLDENTYFGLGSATKVFTVTLLAREVVLKNISLDQKVSEFFPEFVSYPVGRITIKELATHTSGLPRMPDNFDPVLDVGERGELRIGNSGENDPYKDYTADKLFESLRKVTKLGEKKYFYSNVAVGLLTQILRKINNGKSYAEMVEEYILGPMGLYGVKARWSGEVAQNISTKYDAALLPLPYWTDLNAMNGTGVIKVTLAGMKKWVLAQLYPETFPSPLKEAILLTQKIHYEGEKFNLGLGWFFDTFAAVTYQNHNGSTRGFVSELYIDHANKRGLIYLSNSAAEEPGECLVEIFTKKKQCKIEPIPSLENTSILEDRYVIVEKDGYASYMVIKKHKVFDFYYLTIDGDVSHRLFYDQKRKAYYTEQHEYFLEFHENGHGEISEGVSDPITFAFFRLKFIH